MKLQIGDKVRFLNEKGEAVVTQIINKKMVKVAIEEGFEIPVSVEELILVQNPQSLIPSPQSPITNTTKEQPNASSPKMRNKPIPSNPEKSGLRGVYPDLFGAQHPSNIFNFATALTTEEVDLHIEELIDDHRGMSNAEIVLTQLQYFQKRLDRAIFNNQHKIVFIHGVGNGTLKREIRNILKTYNRIHFQDADIRRYGLGATEVEIK